uniref:Synaptosomal-associated protein 29 n=1 Tax=Phallusia mammillata TaxID=59560 RepID=A0A6F9DTT4_9ASCI|nr:synaptosomal-associated protein 29-like [Phallusia mammillata]
MSYGNRWLDDDEVQPTTKGSRWDDNDDFEDFDPNKDYLTQKVEQKQGNILESTKRSLQVLEETESIGIATGQELVRQGEVLRRTENKLDKMDQDLKESDRHLRSIKSMWGAFVNKFSKEPTPDTTPKPEERPRNGEPSSSLHNAITKSDSAYDTQRDYSTNPVLQRQEQNRQQFYNQSESSKPENSAMSQVEENLDYMSQGLSRLKGLAIGMQDEMATQDPVIERLHEKTMKVDNKIHRTNKEMMKLNNS